MVRNLRQRDLYSVGKGRRNWGAQVRSSYTMGHNIIYWFRYLWMIERHDISIMRDYLR